MGRGRVKGSEISMEGVSGGCMVCAERRREVFAGADARSGEAGRWALFFALVLGMRVASGEVEEYAQSEW